MAVTRVCVVGPPGVDLRAELLSYETAREALSTYALATPWENAVAVETVSVGTAVSLLNDLDWYLVRVADDAIVFEPSVSGDEWLSRTLATAIRDGNVDPGETGSYLKLYGVDEGELVEPLYTRRIGERLPEYDLRDVEETVPVRVTESEFGG